MITGKNKTIFNTVTLQQETAYQEYLDDNDNPLNFNDYYKHWCFEKSFRIDLSSEQRKFLLKEEN